MTVVFWVLWGIDLLLTAFVILFGIYREQIGAFNNENHRYSLLLMSVLLGSILVRYVLQWPLLSGVLAAIPLLILLILYVFDL